jgi:hypothetical protein
LSIAFLTHASNTGSSKVILSEEYAGLIEKRHIKSRDKISPDIMFVLFCPKINFKNILNPPPILELKQTK